MRLMFWSSIGAFVLAGCTLGQVGPAPQACTLIGCGASLEVALVGEYVPSEFTVSVNSPNGHIANVHCTDGTAQFDPPEAARWSPACPAGGVTFQEFAPAQVSVTVQWAEGSVTQQFNPAYSNFQPNGPKCEPTCRSAKVEVLIPRIPPYGDESTWETYVDEAHGFSVKYPKALQLEVGPRENGYSVVFFGHQIWIQTSPDDPVVCRGDCPMIESTESLTISGRAARRIQGYVGSIGGVVPQHFMMYVVRVGESYVSFVLYADSTPRQQAEGDPSTIRPLKQEDIDLFERIMRTVVFKL